MVILSYAVSPIKIVSLLYASSMVSNWLYIINASLILLLNTFILTGSTLKASVILCFLIVDYKQSYLYLNYLLLMMYMYIKLTCSFNSILNLYTVFQLMLQ